MQLLRRLTQLTVVAAAAVTGYRLFAGLSMTTVEKYCPMGGLATSYSLLTGGTFSCATGEFNFSLFAALLLMALLVRKSFCSWLCPVGTVSELVGLASGALRRRLGGRRTGNELALFEPGRRLDGGLRWIRVAVLAGVLAATIATAELLFRPFCPYYVMFSFHGHDVELWSYPLLALLLLGMVLVPMIWCRYLCPLSAALSPCSRVGLMRVTREPERCTACGACERACAHSLPVARTLKLTSGECTLCLACVERCPVPGVLTVSAARRRLPGWVVPLAVAGTVALGLFGGRSFTLPSYAREYAPAADATAEVRFRVKGVSCVDTARLAATVFDGFPGVVGLVAYASRNEIVVEHEPAKVTVEKLVKLLEGPVYVESMDEYGFHMYEVLEIDGVARNRPTR